MKTQVHRVVLCIVDHDQLGPDGVKDVIETERWPNDCIGPNVESVETVEVEWSDEHPLNQSDTHADEFARMFPTFNEGYECAKTRVVELLSKELIALQADEFMGDAQQSGSRVELIERLLSVIVNPFF